MIEMKCPECQSTNIRVIIGNLYRCGNCGHKFTEVEEQKVEKRIEYIKKAKEEKENAASIMKDLADDEDKDDDTGDHVGDPEDGDIIFMDGL